MRLHFQKKKKHKKKKHRNAEVPDDDPNSLSGVPQSEFPLDRDRLYGIHVECSSAARQEFVDAVTALGASGALLDASFVTLGGCSQKRWASL